MLKIVQNTPVKLGEKLTLGDSSAQVYHDIFEKGDVYCFKSCFEAEVLDTLRSKVFTHFSALAYTQKNYGGALINDNYHFMEKGISPFQKTLHYFHSYVFDHLAALPAELSDVSRLFHSLGSAYNELTNDNRAITAPHSDNTRFHFQILQYPVGGGMFSSHVHPLTPLKISVILGLSKRGRDYQEGAAGFEAMDGSIIDSSDIHDIGDMLVFRVNQKHWVTPVDIESPLDETLASGRWTAILGIY